jgi:hypothetical protein
VRCHLGVGPQERTAEEHTTRGPPTTRGIFGRGILGGTVSQGWSVSTVRCEGGMYPAQIWMMSGSRQKSSTSCSPELTAGDEFDCSAVSSGAAPQRKWSLTTALNRFSAAVCDHFC